MKILKEETNYYHGSFKDLKTFLDKNGNPYTLIPSKTPEENSKSKSNQQDTSKNQNNNQSNDSQDTSKSDKQSQSNQNNKQYNKDQSDQNTNQNKQQSNQQQNQANQSQDPQENEQKKIPPDPDASYVDVRSGYEYKWNPQKNQFIKVGKYRAK